jgi:ribosomal protein S18 acetylase RimI-like enzyme
LLKKRAYPLSQGEGSLIGELRRMHLRPEYRGKRLGSWLVRGFLLQMAQALQLSQVFLTTMEHNVEAISFYRSLSFDITKTELLEHTTKTLVTMTLYYNGNSNEEQKKN